MGLVAVCGVGIYKFKRRGEMSTSVFLMQLRVAAQGTVVGALSIGLAYTMAQKFLFNKDTADTGTTTTDAITQTAKKWLVPLRQMDRRFKTKLFSQTSNVDKI